MSIIDSVIRTIRCELSEDCKHEITFDRKDEQTIFGNAENAWLKGTRVIQTADARNLVYCSDSCEVKGTATGKHNLPEPPKIQTASNPAQVEAAAKLALARSQAEAAIRSGAPANIQLTD